MAIKKSHSGCLLLLLFLSFVSLSQTLPFAKATADKNRILLGEQIKLELQAKFSAKEPISFFDIDSIPHFEILQRQKIDTSDDRVEIELRQTLILTSFDSGHWVIPSFQLAARKDLNTDSIPVDVAFSAPFDPKQPYHDIKDVIDVQRGQKKSIPGWWWYAAGAYVLLVIILIYVLTRKKKPPPKAVEIDPYQEVVAQLSALMKQQLDAKTYFTKLVDIFRWYLQRRTEVVSVDQTTADLIYQLRSLKLPAYEELRQALLLSDFVKFAKYEPSDRERKVSFEVIKNSIENIEEQHKRKNAIAGNS